MRRHSRWLAARARRAAGFTLVELMAVVAIVAILAAVAIPSYSNYVVRSSRSAAQTELLELAAAQERIFLNSGAYTANLSTAYTGLAAGGPDRHQLLHRHRHAGVGHAAGRRRHDHADLGRRAHLERQVVVSAARG